MSSAFPVVLMVRGALGRPQRDGGALCALCALRDGAQMQAPLWRPVGGVGLHAALQTVTGRHSLSTTTGWTQVVVTGMAHRGVGAGQREARAPEAREGSTWEARSTGGEAAVRVPGDATPSTSVRGTNLRRVVSRCVHIGVRRSSLSDMASLLDSAGSKWALTGFIGRQGPVLEFETGPCIVRHVGEDADGSCWSRAVWSRWRNWAAVAGRPGPRRCTPPGGGKRVLRGWRPLRDRHAARALASRIRAAAVDARRRPVTGMPDLVGPPVRDNEGRAGSGIGCSVVVIAVARRLGGGHGPLSGCLTPRWMWPRPGSRP